MPNTARNHGKSDIKTFIKAASSKQASQLLEVLAIKDDASHERAVELVGDLMDITGDDPGNPLYRVIDVVADAIAHYESQIYTPEPTAPLSVLKFLMEQNDLKQKDMTDIFGTQSIVSEVLSGKREMNLNHVRKLADRFKVSPAVFV